MTISSYDVIQRYWQRTPTDWVGRKDGNPLKMPVFQDLVPWDVGPPKHEPMDNVSYVWEQNVFGDHPAWRVTGTYKGESLIVAWGQL